MKRLLLAPLLIALTGCSTDIVGKTALGEKYIIKESSVQKIYKKWNSVVKKSREINSLESDIKIKEKMLRGFIKDNLDQIEDYKKLMAEHGETVDFIYLQKIQSSLNNNKDYEEELKLNDPKKADLETKKESLEDLIDYVEENKKNVVMLSYTPIYVDLNGKKTIQNQKIVACVDPNLNGGKRQEISELSQESLVLPGNFSIEEKICKQHAKF